MRIVLLDWLACRRCPSCRGRVTLRDSGHGSSWRREWDGERYHTREVLRSRPCH